jgi:hypothetical protein
MSKIPPTTVVQGESAPASGWLQRKCACQGEGECETCKGQKAQRKSRASAPHGDAEQAAADGLSSPGRTLEPDVRQTMEQRFGHDFSSVRIHSDGGAGRSAAALAARAYTVGEHIVFGQGEYAPQSREGRHLLAHELAHTVQQRRSGTTRQGKLTISDSQGSAERAADRAADAVVADRVAPDPGSVDRSIQRKEDTSCDKPHAEAINKAKETSVHWLGSTHAWFDAHLALIKRRAPKYDGDYRRVGPALFAQLRLLDDHFGFANIVRKEWHSRFPDSADWEGSHKEFETLGRASYFIRRNFLRVRVSELDSACERVCPKGQEGAEVVGSARAGSGAFTIYTPCFDKQSEKGQAGVVLHEAFHASFSDFGGDSYSHAKDYPGDSAASNADSYSTFASIVATGSTYRIIVVPETVIDASASGPSP